MNWLSKESNLQKIFEVINTYKIVYALLQIIGGLLLILVHSSFITHLAISVTNGEVAEDPHDFIARLLLFAAHSMSVRVKFFIGAYLIIHGLVNSSLVYGLWKRKEFVYPVAAIVFAIICVYQLHLYLLGHSYVLVLLSIIDVIYISLILHEYRVIRKHHKKK